MPTTRRKLSVVQAGGEQGYAFSKTAQRGNSLNSCFSTGGAPKSDCDLPELCTNQMQRMIQTRAMQKLKKPSISLSMQSQLEKSVVDPL